MLFRSCNEDMQAAEQKKQNAVDVDTLIYKNVGNYYQRAMALAIRPENCNGYANAECTCNFQHSYVICKLGELLEKNHLSSDLIPAWLINPHCDFSNQLAANPRQNFEKTLEHYAAMLDNDNGQKVNATNCEGILANYFAKQDATTCQPPWKL